jgi:hypothetical protein
MWHRTSASVKPRGCTAMSIVFVEWLRKAAGHGEYGRG